MAIDIDQSHYNTGTATVVGTAVTGQGTAWLGTIRPGDLYGTHKGSGVRIASVDSNTSLTLAYVVPALEQTAAAYEIQRTPFDVGYLAAIEDMIRLYGVGNLPSLAGLDGTGGNKLVGLSGAGAAAAIEAKLLLALNALDGTDGNKGVVLTGPNAVDTFPLTTKGRAIVGQEDNAGVLQEIGAQPAGNYLTNSMPTSRIKGRVTAGTGVVEDLTQSQVQTFLGQSAFFNTLLNSTGGADLFTKMGANDLRSANGYVKLPSGIILQWGVSSQGLSDYQQNYTISFPGGMLGIVASSAYSTLPSTAFVGVTVYGANLNGFNVKKRTMTPTNVGPGTDPFPVNWLAIGY